MRQARAAGVALEQFGVQPVLQLLHVLADGRLLRPKHRRRTTEAARFRRGDEVAELAEFH